jgi:hypothetical protein
MMMMRFRKGIIQGAVVEEAEAEERACSLGMMDKHKVVINSSVLYLYTNKMQCKGGKVGIAVCKSSMRGWMAMGEVGVMGHLTRLSSLETDKRDNR